MSTRLRAFLMWLLVAALPLQSLAAATMAGCLPAGHGVAQAERSVSHASQGAADGHDEHRSHAQGHHDATEVASDAASVDVPHHGAKSRCSVCASCCVAAALPATVRSFEAFPSAEFFAPFMTAVAPVFLTGGPERPPRPVLA